MIRHTNDALPILPAGRRWGGHRHLTMPEDLAGSWNAPLRRGADGKFTRDSIVALGYDPDAIASAVVDEPAPASWTNGTSTVPREGQWSEDRRASMREFLDSGGWLRSR